MKKFFKELWVEMKKEWIEYAPYWILMGFSFGVAVVVIFLSIFISIFGICA